MMFGRHGLEVRLLNHARSGGHGNDVAIVDARDPRGQAPHLLGHLVVWQRAGHLGELLGKLDAAMPTQELFGSQRELGRAGWRRSRRKLDIELQGVAEHAEPHQGAA